MSVTKYILPVIGGLIAGMILMTCGAWGIHMLYDIPPGTDMMGLSASAFALLIANYIVCSFLAGAIATIISKRVSPIPALVVGIVLTLSELYNMLRIQQPFLVSIISALSFMPAAWLAYILLRKKHTA